MKSSLIRFSLLICLTFGIFTLVASPAFGDFNESSKYTCNSETGVVTNTKGKTFTLKKFKRAAKKAINKWKKKKKAATSKKKKKKFAAKLSLAKNDKTEGISCINNGGGGGTNVPDEGTRTVQIAGQGAQEGNTATCSLQFGTSSFSGDRLVEGGTYGIISCTFAQEVLISNANVIANPSGDGFSKVIFMSTSFGAIASTTYSRDFCSPAGDPCESAEEGLETLGGGGDFVNLTITLGDGGDTLFASGQITGLDS